ncbi:MAG: family 43 glycosylhydrolase [Paludibacter sp.]|nr:family 43 glycosylhydrolase [Paludibacter sp.]
MTATITKGNSTTSKSFEVYVAEDEGFAGYLFTYFTGNAISQEAIRFALSDDGLIYKALNKNQPIIASSTISLTGGVRDPHMLRCEDGKTFYMVVTDMVSANGWNSNRGIVLLKSADLINWTSATVNIPTVFPAEFGNVDRVWAPQTIYDASVGKYMIYFSMRKGSTDFDKFYYAYSNSSFTALESAPKQLFFNPAGTACIDGDIIEKDGQFHLFFKTEGSGNGIKKAVSGKLTEGWIMLNKYLDQNANAVEGGCVFRMYNTDEYILMYDVYTSGYYEFTKSTDLENFSVMSGNAFDFTPRHGTVIPVTAAEITTLKNKWMNTGIENTWKNSDFQIFPNPANDFIIITGEKIEVDQPEVCILDAHGRKILCQKISLPNEQISLKELKSGFYFGVIKNKNLNINTFKFVKK